MPTSISTGSLRQHLADTLKRAESQKDRIVVERNGRPVAVIVPVEDLNALEAIEDADDLRAADEARAEAGAHPLADVIREIDAETNHRG